MRQCILCGEDSKDSYYYTDNGVDQEPYVCDFCYDNLRRVKGENQHE